MQLNSNTRSKLIQLSQRPLKPGEVFLLSKLMADKIPVIEDGQIPQSTLAHTLKYRRYVDNVIFTLNDYAHICPQTCAHIYEMVDSIWNWRYAISTGSAGMLFSGEHDTVVDDVSSLLRYINSSDICALADMARDANYMTALLGEVVNQTWG